PFGRPYDCPSAALSGESGLTVLQPDQRVLTRLRGKSVVLRLEPGEFCLQIPDALLKTAQFGDHTRIRTADVAKDSLRHGKVTSTLSDQTICALQAAGGCA